MYCKNCGNEIKENEKFCQNCGYKNEINFAVKENKLSFDSKSFILNLINVLVGTVMTIVGAVMYSNDTSGIFPSYTYTSPLTAHEILVMALIIFGSIALTVGIVSFLLPFIKKK